MKTNSILLKFQRFLLLGLLLSGLALEMAAAEVVYIPAGRPTVPTGSPGWRYRLASTEASTPIAAWRTNNFAEDGSWATGALPLGYTTGANDPLGYEAVLVTTVPAATTGVYLRKTFVVTNRASISSLNLSLVVDDGVVVWINGREVMRFQCCTGGTDPNEPTFNSLATTANDSTANSVTIPNEAGGPLIDGTNVIAVQLFNANNTSSDLVLDLSLSGTIDDVPPTLISRSPTAGSTVEQLNSIQVNFSENVTGVDAADLLINGQAAASVLAVSPSIYTFQFPQPPTGAVSVAFAPGHGISDQSVPPNAFAGDNWGYTLNTNVTLPLFMITEFLASNSGSGTNALRDEDGASSDWIEIYNSLNAIGNIGGWYLTDDINNLTKWRFPNGASVPARGYLTVFASGKNRTNANSRLHTNFQLNNSGEYLALVNPQTNVVSQFSPVYPAQQTDVSYGRDRLNPGQLGYYTVPTPGADNAVSGAGFGPEVVFSRAGGTYAESFTLALSTTDSNSVIRYTIVSSAQGVNTATNIPTPNSTLYTGPITINGSVQVRARAFSSNPTFFPGPPHTESYIQVNPAITNFVSTLPIVVIHTLDTAALSGGYPSPDNSVSVAFFDNDNPTGRAGIMDKPQLVKRAGINLRGSSTQGFSKSSYAVELLDEFNSDEESEVLGLPKESDWVLYAPNQFDISMMHNRILHQFGRDFGYYSSRTRFVEVFFHNGTGAINATTNTTGTGMGDYAGVYVLEEKVKIDGNRLDIDKLEIENTNAPSITGGYLLKIDRTDGNERTFTGGNVTINYQDPDGLEMVTPARSAQAAYIKAVFDNFNTGLTGNALTNIASTNHYSRYLDIDATIDLHIVNVLTMNADAYRLSGYIYKPRNGKLVFGPLWDVDRGLGTSRGDSRTYAPRAWQSYDASSCGGTDFGTDFFQGTTTPAWLGRLFADPDFWQRWIDRYQDWRTTMLDSNRVMAIIDQFGAEVREAQPREQKRWAGNANGSDTSPRNGTVANCANTFTHTFNGTYQGEVDFQKRWLMEHLHFMDTNFLNRPAFPLGGGQVPSGTLVTLNDRSGKFGTRIFYTLDGSDPRGFQGTTNPAAIAYSGPIVITNNVRIRARAFNPTHRNLTGTMATGSRNPVLSSGWSGDVSETYYITPPPLVVTELMYHPAPPSLITDTNNADNFEYIELKNVGSTTLSLVGCTFTSGIDFTFTTSNAVTTLAPGAHVLIVKNLASFNSRYGAGLNVAGVFGGNLDNSGERITLVGARGEPILDFEYSDTWNPLTDGFGYSLVIRNPNASLDSWGNAGSWTASVGLGGSPGGVEPAPNAVPHIVINEALTHTDLPQIDVIELYNPTASSVDVGGWYLSDDGGDPFKFQIPSPTVIPAGGYVTFDETQFNVGLKPFSVSSEGDEIYLFSATAPGQLSGYVHGHVFGAAQNGVTFGRYLNSQGDEHFVAQATNTLGFANSLPAVGPVVISEIMYHPPNAPLYGGLTDNSVDEYIELRNLTAQSVNLFNPLHASNTWQLRSSVSFDFPTNTTLAANGTLLVVNFDPVTNLTQLSLFQAKYGVAPGTPIYGPYGGKLDNSAESVRLRRPDNPSTNGNVPYILVDQVDYAHAGAWPVGADGLGASLQRMVLGAYGNDPTNWAAARPTAAAGWAGGTAPVITLQPANAAGFVQGAATFTAAASGSGVTYQWLLNGDFIPGATNSSLTLNSLQLSQAGAYRVVAMNAAGSAVSQTAYLNVLIPITFAQEPVSQNVLPGTNVTLLAGAIGNGTIRYQWQFEGVDISGATNSSYSFTNAQLTQHGNYRVTAIDTLSSVTSSNAFIFVRIVPVIINQPVPQFVVRGGTAVFSTMATGAPPIYYRWLRNGQLWVSNQNPNLVITNASSNGTFRVQAVNVAGTVNSTPTAGVGLTVLADFDQDGLADLWEVRYGFDTNSPAGFKPRHGRGRRERPERVHLGNQPDQCSQLPEGGSERVQQRHASVPRRDQHQLRHPVSHQSLLGGLDHADQHRGRDHGAAHGDRDPARPG